MSDILTPRSYIENRQLASVTDASSSASSTQTASTQSTAPGFFGPDGPSFRDVLDAINPLNHIPVVSSILADATGHTPSVASQLVGGAIFGPVGFFASLANVVFEQQTGKDIGGSMYAALSGDTPSSIQVAANTKPQSSQDDAQPMEVASIDPSQASLSAQLTAQASADNGGASSGNSGGDTNKDVLALFGASTAPAASKAYQNAQFRSYLKESSQTQVL